MSGRNSEQKQRKVQSVLMWASWVELTQKSSIEKPRREVPHSRPPPHQHARITQALQAPASPPPYPRH